MRADVVDYDEHASGEGKEGASLVTRSFVEASEHARVREALDARRDDEA